MGFGAGDEIGEVRYGLAEESLPDVEFTLVEGDLDIQQFHSAVAAGDPPGLVYANRDQIGTSASRAAIIPLDQCIEGEGSTPRCSTSPRSTRSPSATRSTRARSSIQMTMAHQQLLDAAGLSIEDVNGSDWEAVTAATEKLKVDAGGSSR